MLDPGDLFDSPGHGFSYRVEGPCCRLFDREDLPWPCCRLSWRGKEPSWRRVGVRLVPDIATRRHPSYAVTGWDRSGNTWQTVLTDFSYLLPPGERRWWYARTPPPGGSWPERPGAE